MSKKALIEKKNELIVRAESIVNEAEAQNRELTMDEAEEIAEIRDDVRKIKAKIGLMDDVEEMSREKCGEAKKRDEGEAAPAEATEDAKESEEAEVRSFEAYVRSQLQLAGSEAQLRTDNTPLTMGNNGAIVPKTIAKKIIAEVYNISPIAERATKYNVKGTLAIPKYVEDDTDFIDVAFQGPEFAALSANSGTFETVNLNDYVAGAIAKLSRSLINNVDFDIVGYIVGRVAYSIKRFLEKNLLLGSGTISGQTGTVAGLTGVKLTTTTAAPTAITANELIEVQDSVKDEFQDKAIWIMSTKTRTALRQLKDNMGRYMLQDDISLPFGHALLGKPIFVSDNMPEMAAGNTAIYYGDISGLALKFVENLEIQVLRELYAPQHADAINAWFSFDAAVENEQKIAKLVMAGSAPESE